MQYSRAGIHLTPRQRPLGGLFPTSLYPYIPVGVDSGLRRNDDAEEFEPKLKAPLLYSAFPQHFIPCDKAPKWF